MPEQAQKCGRCESLPPVLRERVGKRKADEERCHARKLDRKDHRLALHQQTLRFNFALELAEAERYIVLLFAVDQVSLWL